MTSKASKRVGFIYTVAIFFDFILLILLDESGDSKMLCRSTPNSLIPSYTNKLAQIPVRLFPKKDTDAIIPAAATAADTATEKKY